MARPTSTFPWGSWPRGELAILGARGGPVPPDIAAALSEGTERAEAPWGSQVWEMRSLLLDTLSAGWPLRFLETRQCASPSPAVPARTGADAPVLDSVHSKISWPQPSLLSPAPSWLQLAQGKHIKA